MQILFRSNGMKISLKSIKSLNYIYETGFDPYDYTPEEIVEKIGLQLGNVESVEDRRGWYQDAVAVKVIECVKHPNADKLSLCKIDDGGANQNVQRDESGLVQVVCGAPNVSQGMFTVWLPPQSIVPSSRTDEQPFELDARELRGEMSNGMLASPKELALSDEHVGIIVLEDDGRYQDMQPGTPLTKLLNVDDVIIELENKMFTHRPDCFGELGVARELSGIFGQQFTSPDWYKTATIDNRALATKNETLLPIDTVNNVQEKVPRFMLQSIANVEFGKSSYQTQLNLAKVDIKPINEIVDWTNYFMHMTGQPLHAYDYDKVVSLSSGERAVVTTRMAEEGETLKLLNGKEIELSADDIVIATDTKVIGLAGVMGGSETEVDENTKNIIIECGTFDMYAIRRTSMRHGLFTEAVTRFNKGQSPLQNDRVLSKITDWLWGFAKGTLASPMYDSTNFDLQADNLNHVIVKLNFINSRLGTVLEFAEVKKLLESVEFIVSYHHDGSPEDDPTMIVTAPFWRMDISIAEDIVEEVGRLHGYQNIPVSLPKRVMKPAPYNPIRKYKNDIRTVLSKQGANEVLTYSFVHGKLLENVGIDPEEYSYHLRNALSPELQFYRPSLLPSLLAKITPNIRAYEGQSNNDFALFELGKAHVKGHQDETEKAVPAEYQRLSYVRAADQKSSKNFKNAAYYEVKSVIDVLTDGKAAYLELDTNKHPITAPFQIGRSAIVEVDGVVLGVVGEFRSEVSKTLKLPTCCAGFELDVELLMKHRKSPVYRKLSSFPSTFQDITFEVGSDISWSALYAILRAEFEVVDAEDNLLYDITPGEIFVPEDSDKKRITFHIELASYEKTLQSSDVNTILETISKVAHERLEAVRI